MSDFYIKAFWSCTLNLFAILTPLLYLSPSPHLPPIVFVTEATIFIIFIASLLFSPLDVLYPNVTFHQLTIDKILNNCEASASQAWPLHLPPAAGFLLPSEWWVIHLQNPILRLCVLEPLLVLIYGCVSHYWKFTPGGFKLPRPQAWVPNRFHEVSNCHVVPTWSSESPYRVGCFTSSWNRTSVQGLRRYGSEIAHKWYLVYIQAIHRK